MCTIGFEGWDFDLPPTDNWTVAKNIRKHLKS